MTDKDKLDKFFLTLKQRAKVLANKKNDSEYADIAFTEICYILQDAQNIGLIDSCRYD